MVAHLKARATQQLRAEEIHPFAQLESTNAELPTCWAAKFWKVFIDNEAQVDSAIRYVQENPLKEGKRKQNWRFVHDPARGKPRG